MNGLLDAMFGTPDKAQAMGLLGLGLMGRNPQQGLLSAMEHMAGAPDRQFKRQYMQAQMDNIMSESEARKLKAQQDALALELARKKREALPGLLQPPRLTGGEAMPQTEGGIPMFSRPMNVSPMSMTPGGVDVMAALRANYTPEEIEKLHGLTKLGLPKVARTIKGMGKDGREYEYQVDEHGQRVGDGMPQYRAPLQVGQGDRTTFADPYTLKPVGSFGINQSPDSRASTQVAWANYNETKRHHGVTEENQAQTREAGKWQYDGARGGLVNMQTAEFKPAMQNGQPVETKASREAQKEDLQRRGSIENAKSVLSEVRDAKKLVGWDTAGVGGLASIIPATNARDLRAKMETIKANLGFDRLQQMRTESPTGGALGQVAVQELAALQATVASLDQLQGPTQLGQALDKIEKHYTNWHNVMEQARKSQGGASGTWDNQKPKTKGGASVSNW